MSKCPFWSIKGKVYRCYNECPMLEDEGFEDEGNCIFKEYDLSTKVNFKDVSKKNYSFLDLSEYDKPKKEKVNY